MLPNHAKMASDSESEIEVMLTLAPTIDLEENIKPHLNIGQYETMGRDNKFNKKKLH